MTKVLVIGDIIIDRYIYGTSERLSPEAPVPIVKQQKIVETLGGAGLVYENLKSLGVDVDLYNPNNIKSIKTRVICDNHYVSRIDDDHIADSSKLLRDLRTKELSIYDYVILSDYNKGALDLVEEIIDLINQAGCKIIVDPKRIASRYKGAWLVKPNKKEYKELGFSSWGSNIIVTDADNCLIAQIDDVEYTVNPVKVEVNDVTGAGDCFVAAFVYALVQNKDYQLSLEIAVEAASESVKHIGTYILQPSDIHNTVVFTNGVFDILHQGHLELLKKASSLGKKLIVGINSDDSVKRLKGNSRPINNQQTRLEQIKILPWVHSAFIFDEDTPYNLIKQIRPGIIVKGGDYTVEQVVGNNLADVYIFPTLKNFSTTTIIKASK